MNLLLKTVGHLWMLPNTIISGAYILPLCLIGQIRFNRFALSGVECRTVKAGWLDDSLRVGDWLGWTSGCFVILRHDAGGRTLPHEERHVRQQMVFGLFAPILYFFASLFIFLFLKDLHSYYDNPFEVDARRFAGQPVKIPRDAWANPRDRWAWW